MVSIVVTCSVRWGIGSAGNARRKFAGLIESANSGKYLAGQNILFVMTVVFPSGSLTETGSNSYCGTEKLNGRFRKTRRSARDRPRKSASRRGLRRSPALSELPCPASPDRQRSISWRQFCGCLAIAHRCECRSPRTGHSCGTARSRSKILNRRSRTAPLHVAA